MTAANLAADSDELIIIEENMKGCWNYAGQPSPEKDKKVLETLNKCTEDLQRLLTNLIAIGIPHDTKMEARITALVGGLKYLLKIKNKKAYKKFDKVFSAYQRLQMRNSSAHECAKGDHNPLLCQDQRQDFQTNGTCEVEHHIPAGDGAMPAQEGNEYRQQVAEDDDVDLIRAMPSAQEKPAYGEMITENAKTIPLSAEDEGIATLETSGQIKKDYDVRDQFPHSLYVDASGLRMPSVTHSGTQTDPNAVPLSLNHRRNSSQSAVHQFATDTETTKNREKDTPGDQFQNSLIVDLSGPQMRSVAHSGSRPNRGAIRVTVGDQEGSSRRAGETLRQLDIVDVSVSTKRRNKNATTNFIKDVAVASLWLIILVVVLGATAYISSEYQKERIRVCMAQQRLPFGFFKQRPCIEKELSNTIGLKWLQMIARWLAGRVY